MKHLKFVERFVMIILPLVMSFVLGVMLSARVLIKQPFLLYEMLTVIVFSFLLIYYVLNQMEGEQ